MSLERRRVQGEIEKVITKKTFPGTGIPIIRGAGAVDASAVLALISKTLFPLVSSLPPYLRLSFYRYVITGFYEFEKRHSEEITAFTKKREQSNPAHQSTEVDKKTLTSDSLKSNCKGVKSDLEKLIARVKQLCARQGAKKNLRGFLKLLLHA